ncbi:response regulator [Actinoplanes sp. CA-030573]|uniref:response regulator n=1 Tax=Actinoplanes sp. CA-030573 TaxID=3239898 RepID=UPI003D8AFB8B
MTVRVVVADDQALVRAGLCGIVDVAEDLSVVGEAGTGREAVEVVHRLDPDVVLMDVRMPDLDGIEATRRITAEAAARVLILTTFDLDEYVYAALGAGASGFLLKDAPPADLHAAIRIVAAGDALLAPRVTRRVIATFAERTPPPALPSLAPLTDRERQVLALVADGLTNAEIGARLHITAGTAKTHVARLLHKLAARDRVQLVILAHRAGLAG